jgi:hypothetical protein
MSVLKENRGGVGKVSQRHLLKAVSDTVRFKPAYSTSGHVHDFPSFFSSVQVPSIPPGSDDFYRQFEKRARGGGSRSFSATA